MDLCLDEAWVKEAARIEDECNGQVEAGSAMKQYAEAKYDPAKADVRRKMRQQMRVQSILFFELKRWMMEWEIGIAFDETYTEARQLVRSHLKQPTPALKDWVEAVLIEDDEAQAVIDKPVHAQTRAQLVLMMSDEDWATLAQVAANAAAHIASASVLRAGKAESLSTIAA